jgi:hypothetical protein
MIIVDALRGTAVDRDAHTSRTSPAAVTAPMPCVEPVKPPRLQIGLHLVATFSTIVRSRG